MEGPARRRRPVNDINVLLLLRGRAQKSELYRYVFGRYVRNRLGVAISELSRPPVSHIKVGVPLGDLPKDTTSELAGLFFSCSSQHSLDAEPQAGKQAIPFYKDFLYDSTKGMNPRSTDCKADAPTIMHRVDLTTMPTYKSRPTSTS